jgi:hypothetical protein
MRFVGGREETFYVSIPNSDCLFQLPRLVKLFHADKRLWYDTIQ